LDDDQDRQNPAYVPRKGAFFEHDLRLDDDGGERDQNQSKKDAKT
jgi:protein CASC3